ncbi:centromere protein K isoform X1 [Salmo salar]|uniref:Centromere protein K isoform X1 n=2 Tax=Salmo salar TaxID=8030 RepID=A0A1S3Q204_SALSA|nr:centromere protein K isoform X1 [Salmo salar]|eukprot:XP_014033474.1 PREDICTED: centromere protein K-like isoform X1 [Salmo salar]
MSSNEVTLRQESTGQPLDTESEVQDTPAPPAIPFYTECSEAAQAELFNECEAQFAQLEMLQNEIILAEPDSDENPQEQSVNRLTAVAAELKQWQTRRPELLSTNPEVLLVVGAEELQKLNSQLELVLSCAQAKRDTLRETLKSEQKWLEEKKEVLRAGTEHVVKQRLENERLSEHSVLQDTKKKIQKMKDYQNRLMETLADVLAEHFPLPTQETNADKKKKNIPQELNENLISLNEVLELLMNKTLETPHDPYVSIDETFWPPYTEMLLRHGIAQRHPEDCFKIRLETFY